MKTTNKKQLTLLLAALTMAAPQIGALSPSLQNTPLGAATAEAQTYRRGQDYRDSDLNRMAWITQRGKVTSNPRDDYLEMRTDDGQNLRVVTRANVSLKKIKRNDRVEVYGKRDGGILIAYSVKEISGSSNNSNSKTVRGTVASDLRGDRFSIRIYNKDYIVVARNGEPNSVRKGREVEVTGRWEGQVFYADRVRVLNNNDNTNNNTNSNERFLYGIVTSDNDNRRFSLRLNDGRTVNVISDERTPARLSRGDTVAVEGKWSSSGRWNNDNVFRASRLRVVRNNDYSNNNNNSSNRNERTLQGIVQSDNDMRRFTIRTNDRRDVTVVSDERNPRRLSRGDTVVVEGRWDWNQIGNKRDNVFRATSVRIIRNNTSSQNGTKVDFRGTIMRASQNRRNWEYVVRNDGRDYLVTSKEKFRINDRVRVRGVLHNGRITATDIDRA
jgi:uncharacterized protein YdeI (BOF family)